MVFTEEARQALRVIGYISRKKFEGHEAVQAGVFRFVNHAHAVPRAE